MRILFADAFEQSGLEALAGRGHDLDYRPELTAADLPAALGEAEVLVVRSTRVEAPVFAGEGPLGLVIRAGAGTNTIDTAAAAARGVFVANVPGKNAVAVAELTIGLILAIDRKIPDNVADARAGRWNKATYSRADGLLGKHLGVFGLGEIGLAVAERAAAFGMRVLAVAKSRPPDTADRMRSAGVRTVADAESLAERSDILTFHLPATPATRHFVNAELLQHVRPGSWIINTSRGDLVDEAALVAAIEAKDLWVGIDVFEDEPAGGTGEFTSVLAQHPRVYTTHHIGASTAQAQDAIAAEVVAIIAAYERGEVRNVVNLTPAPPIGSVLVVRHYDRVGVLSAVLGALKQAGLNVQEMQNQVFAGAGAAVASIHVEGDVPAGVRADILASPDVISVSVRPVTP
jgi:D-3-phosphoglycerate dehydrogenase